MDDKLPPFSTWRFLKFVWRHVRDGNPIEGIRTIDTLRELIDMHDREFLKAKKAVEQDCDYEKFLVHLEKCDNILAAFRQEHIRAFGE